MTTSIILLEMKRPVSETHFKSSKSLSDENEDSKSQNRSAYSQETLSSVSSGGSTDYYDVQYPEAVGYSRDTMSICELQKIDIQTKLMIFHVIVFHVIFHASVGN